MGGLAMAANLFDISREPADLGPLPPEPIAHPSGMLGRIAQSFQFEVNHAPFVVATHRQQCLVSKKIYQMTVSYLKMLHLLLNLRHLMI